MMQWCIINSHLEWKIVYHQETAHYAFYTLDP